jgi:putative membrane protein
MIRILTLAAAIAVATSLPALAVEATCKVPAATTEAGPAARGNLFTEDRARVHFAHLGYTNISGLTKDENGAWRGSAMKDGKSSPLP